MATPIAWLRWLKSLYRRLLEDWQLERQRQLWWQQRVSVSPQAIIRLSPGAVLEIGPETLIGSHTILDLLSDPMRQGPGTSVLRIGHHTAINEFNSIRVGGGQISIGNSCLISQFVSIIGSNHGIAMGMPMRDQPWDTTRSTVTIGNDVWVGTHAVILPGVTIGSGSIIAAGAVVTHDIPEYVVAAGVPAGVKRRREKLG